MGSGPRRGPKIGVKIAPGWPKIPHFWAPFWRGSGQNLSKTRENSCIFCSGPAQNPSRKGPQNGVKMAQNTPFLGPFLDPFWPVPVQARRPYRGISARTRPEPLQKGVPKRAYFDPSWPKRGQNRAPFWDPFLEGFSEHTHDFGPQNGPKKGPKRAQNGSKYPILDPYFGPLLDRV